jgi:hypothetical protein
MFVITQGFGGSLTITQGYIGGAGPTVPTTDSLEWTPGVSRLHYDVKENRLHYTPGVNRLHYGTRQR